MTSEDQSQAQATLIKKMLEVSPYYTDVQVTVAEDGMTLAVFDIGTLTFIEVRYKHVGNDEYLPGYYKPVGGFGSEPPDLEEVYIGKELSLHSACVKIVTRRYEDELHAAMEGWNTEPLQEAS
jgi:hypothetical protein